MVLAARRRKDRPKEIRGSSPRVRVPIWPLLKRVWMPLASLGFLLAYSSAGCKASVDAAEQLRLANDKLSVTATIRSEPLLVGSSDTKIRSAFGANAKVGDWGHRSTSEFVGADAIVKRYQFDLIRFSDETNDKRLPETIWTTSHENLKFSWAGESRNWVLVTGQTYNYKPIRAKDSPTAVNRWVPGSYECWLLSRNKQLWTIQAFWYDVELQRLADAVKDLAGFALTTNGRDSVVKFDQADLEELVKRT